MDSEAGVRWLPLAAIVAGAALTIACTAGGKSKATTQDVVFNIPWTVPETARYRVLDDDEVVGTAVLGIEAAGEDLSLKQEFEDNESEFRTRVTALVDGKTLKPELVEMVLTGPEGPRECKATYTAGLVEVRQKGQGEERTDRLELPEHAYDSWTDLFLWRSIELRRGYLASYRDIGTCLLRKPGQATVTLEVINRERVIVPAGSFDAWRLEFRSGGPKQRAWIADTPERTLVRYDNGQQVFELASLER